MKALAFRDASGMGHLPNPEAVRHGDYALSRDLYLYLNLPPDEPLPPAERAFVSLVLSPRGQTIVEELGFVALPEPMLERQQRELALDEAGR